MIEISRKICEDELNNYDLCISKICDKMLDCNDCPFSVDNGKCLLDKSYSILYKLIEEHFDKELTPHQYTGKLIDSDVWVTGVYYQHHNIACSPLDLESDSNIKHYIIQDKMIDWGFPNKIVFVEVDKETIKMVK